MFGDDLRDRSPETADDIVFLHGQDDGGPLCGAGDGVGVEGLDGVHVDDSRGDPACVQSLRRLESGMHHRSCGDDREVGAGAVFDGGADGEGVSAVSVDVRVLTTADTEVDRCGMVDGGAERGSELSGVSGGDDREPGMLRVMARSSVAWCEVP